GAAAGGAGGKRRSEDRLLLREHGVAGGERFFGFAVAGGRSGLERHLRRETRIEGRREAREVGSQWHTLERSGREDRVARFHRLAESAAIVGGRVRRAPGAVGADAHGDL